MIKMELYELKTMILELSELGAANYAKVVFPAKDLISQRQAYRDYGEARVKRWVKMGLISSHRNGSTIRSKILYSRAELMSVGTSEKINYIINR